MRFSITYATLVTFSWLVIEVVACKNKMSIFRRMSPAAGQTSTPKTHPLPAWLGMKRTKVVAGRNSILIQLEGKYEGHANPVMKYYHDLQGHPHLHGVVLEFRNFQKMGKYIDGGMVNAGQAGYSVYLLLKDMPDKEAGVDWSTTRHSGLPEGPECVPFHRHGKLPLPPSPGIPVQSIRNIQSTDTQIPDLEDSIIKDTKGGRTWQIDKAQYIRFNSKSQVVQVSWLKNIGDINLFKTTTSHLQAVNQFIGCGFLELKKDQRIAYLVMKFEGEIEEFIKPPLPQNVKKDLQQKAVERYKSSYGMFNRGFDTSFSYIGTTEAFLYEWTFAQHVDTGFNPIPMFDPSSPPERKAFLTEIFKLFQDHHTGVPLPT